MKQIDERLEELISAYLDGELSPEEKQELDNWLEMSDENRKYLHSMETIRNRVFILKPNRQPDVISAFVKVKKEAGRKKRLLRQLLPYAAAVTLLFAVALVFILYPQPGNIEEHRQFSAVSEPGREQALLQLNNGKEIFLSNFLRDTIFNIDNKTSLGIDSNRRLHYNQLSEIFDKDSPNRLVIPQGGEYRIVLDDGTVVWLNSVSVLEFPTAFGDKERRVKLSGEGYFQVKRDSSRPFIVDTEGLSVRVLGTDFNVNTYHPDRVSATLIEGSVEIVALQGDKRIVLKPGEQAVTRGEDIRVETVDLAYITSWRDGKFNFEHTTLEELSQQVSRWYNVEIVFSDPALKTVHFTGSMQKFEPLEKLIARIESTGNVRFSVKGDKIIIMEK